jgi:phosphoglycolate phosphatase
VTDRPEAILFDFDFTLADSSAAIIECTHHALDLLGHERCESARIRSCIGLPLPEMYRRLTGEDARAQRFFDAFMARADEIMESMTVLYDDAFDAVARLRSTGARTGIVSTKARRRITNVLVARGRDHLFDIVVGLEDVHSPKPDPAGILLAVRHLGVTPSRTLYIGDHPVDAQAAMAAGVQFCGVLTGEPHGAHFESAGHRCSPCVADALRAWAGDEPHRLNSPECPPQPKPGPRASSSRG